MWRTTKNPLSIKQFNTTQETISTDDIVVSVIMLTYNHKDYIEQAIKSVMMQETNFEYELLIGDDASIDGTSLIVEKLSCEYPNKIKAFIRNENLGPTKNLAELLKIAKGKYIASCEGDDYWISKDKLQIQVEFLEENKCYIGCTHNIDIVDSNSTLIPNSTSNWISKSKELSLNEFDGFNLPGHAVSMVYRNIFFGSDLPDDIARLHRIIADRTIVAMLLLRGNIYKFDEVMAAYRFTRKIGSNSATNSICDSKDHFYQEYKYTKRLEKYLSTNLGNNIYFFSTRKHFINENIKEVRYAHRFIGACYIPLMIFDYFITRIRRALRNV